MAGNTYSKECVADGSKPPPISEESKKQHASLKTGVSSCKAKRNEQSKCATKEVTEDKSQGSRSLSKKSTSKDAISSKESKCKPSAEYKDVFAKIASGESKAPVVANPPPNATVACENNKGHGHIIQKGRFRYSPGFEILRKTTKETNKDGQKGKKSPDKIPLKGSKQTQPPKVQPSNSFEVIHGASKEGGDKKVVKKNSDAKNSKKKIEKSLSEKRKRKLAKSVSSHSSVSSVPSVHFEGGGSIRPLGAKETTGKTGCDKHPTVSKSKATEGSLCKTKTIEKKHG